LQRGLLSGLTAFARTHAIGAAHLTAIGALQDLVLGYFDWRAKRYRKTVVSEQVEVLALLRDIALKDGEPSLWWARRMAPPTGAICWKGTSVRPWRWP
jgi:predicted DNA-binding protein with PD1-like motif